MKAEKWLLIIIVNVAWALLIVEGSKMTFCYYFICRLFYCEELSNWIIPILFTRGSFSVTCIYLYFSICVYFLVSLLVLIVACLPSYLHYACVPVVKYAYIKFDICFWYEISRQLNLWEICRAHVYVVESYIPSPTLNFLTCVNIVHIVIQANIVIQAIVCKGFK